MTIEKRKTQIKIILDQYKNLFFKDHLSSPRVANKIIYFPDQVPLDQPSGEPLKDGVGFLSIKEEIQEDIDRPISYIYRFTTNEFDYIAAKKSCSETWQGFFNFHYQKDDGHQSPHVSFLHSAIRYLSRDITLEEFLMFIKETFFRSDGLRKQGKPWDSTFN